jgi:DNA-binding response OmpR family regulator
MKILLIEDDVTMSADLANGLAQVGWHVECVFDGNEGLDTAVQSEFDVL